MTTKNKKQKTLKNNDPLFIAIASVLWITLYTLFATITNLKEWLISSGVLGWSGCSSCNTEDTVQLILAVLLPLAIGSAGLGYTFTKVLTRETVLIKSIAGIVVFSLVLWFSYYAFGLTNFLVNYRF